MGFEILLAAMNKVIKSIQRGVTVSASTITINEVNPNKTVVLSKSKGSAGYVAATGNISLTPSGGKTTFFEEYGPSGLVSGSFPSYSGSISGGSTNLTVKEFSAKLVNSTSLSCDGPVEWQVVEFR
jgi:hypothetical protein